MCLTQQCLTLSHVAMQSRNNYCMFAVKCDNREEEEDVLDAFHGIVCKQTESNRQRPAMIKVKNCFLKAKIEF